MEGEARAAVAGLFAAHMFPTVQNTPPPHTHTQPAAEGTAQTQVPLRSHLQKGDAQECKPMPHVGAAERPELSPPSRSTGREEGPLEWRSLKPHEISLAKP